MGVSPTNGVTCWCLCRVVTLCTLDVMLSTCGIPICLGSPVCAHDQLVKAGPTAEYYYLLARTYKIRPHAEKPGKSSYPLPREKTLSTRHASHRARIEPKPRPMCSAGPPVSGYSACCRKALARREKLRKVRKIHQQTIHISIPGNLYLGKNLK